MSSLAELGATGVDLSSICDPLQSLTERAQTIGMKRLRDAARHVLRTINSQGISQPMDLSRHPIMSLEEARRYAQESKEFLESVPYTDSPIIFYGPPTTGPSFSRFGGGLVGYCVRTFPLHPVPENDNPKVYMYGSPHPDDISIKMGATALAAASENRAIRIALALTCGSAERNDLGHDASTAGVVRASELWLESFVLGMNQLKIIVRKKLDPQTRELMHDEHEQEIEALGLDEWFIRDSRETMSLSIALARHELPNGAPLKRIYVPGSPDSHPDHQGLHSIVEGLGWGINPAFYQSFIPIPQGQRYGPVTTYEYVTWPGKENLEGPYSRTLYDIWGSVMKAKVMAIAIHKSQGPNYPVWPIMHDIYLGGILSVDSKQPPAVEMFRKVEPPDDTVVTFRNSVKAAAMFNNALLYEDK